MAKLNLCQTFEDNVWSWHSYQFNLNITVKAGWLHFLKIGYVVVFAVIMGLVYYTGGWNFKEAGVSSIVIKVKGAALSDNVIWDATDYVYPPQEVRAVFITTKAVITKQTQSICPDNNKKMNCSNDSECESKRRTENGIKTGKCDKKTGSCLIKAWCPLENIRSNFTKIVKIHEALNFIVYVRDHEEFIKFNKSVSNDLHSRKSSTNCLFNSTTDPTCPNFNVSDILKEANVKFQDVMNLGGIFQFYIKWHCFFNWNSSPCKPRYSFKRIAKESEKRFSGYSMRYAIYQDNNGTRQRELITAYGLRFLIMIKSRGEQFRYTTLLSSVGSYLSYFGIWTFIAAILCLIFLRDRNNLLYLDECIIKKLVKEDDETEMKAIIKQEPENSHKTALMANC